jgi:hypothetical protein
MSEPGPAPHPSDVPQFVIHHRHAADDCGAAFASFRGVASPLRHTTALASCRDGGHEIWWSVTAADAAAALALLPRFVAARSTATPVARVRIP